MVFKKGQKAWNKGLSADPNSPNYDPRVAKYANTLTGRTFSDEHKNNIRKMRLSQSPEKRSEIGRIGGTALMNKLTPEERSEKAKQAAMTFVKNTPLDIRMEMYLSNARLMNEANMKLPPERRSEIASIAALTGTPEERSERASRAAKALWSNLSNEERAELIKKITSTLLEHPNNEEKRLQALLESYGFLFNFGEIILGGYSNIYKRTRSVIPDFYRPNTPVVIQNDGGAGHDPIMPYIPDNQPQLDNERDEICRKNGYDVIRITPEDHKNSDEQLLELIRDRLNAFGYSLR